MEVKYTAVEFAGKHNIGRGFLSKAVQLKRLFGREIGERRRSKERLGSADLSAVINR